MLDTPLIVAWYVFLLIAVWMFHRLTQCLTRLNIFSLFVFFLVLRHGITVPFDHTTNQWFAGIYVSEDALQHFYLALLLMYGGLLLGIFLGRYLFGSGKIELRNFQSAMSAKHLPGGINWFVFIVVLAVVVGLITATLLRTDVSLTDLLSGVFSSEEYRALRDDYGQATNFSSSWLLRLASIARFGLLPFLIYTLFFLKERNWIWWTAFIFVTGLGVVVGVLSGEKSPALFLLIGLVVAFYLRKGWTRLSPFDWRLWSLATLGLFVILPYLYSLQYPTLNYEQTVQSALYRLTSEYNRSLQLYFEIYPNIQPHLYGLSSSLINSVLGTNTPVDMLPERFIPIYYLGPQYLHTWNAAYVGTAWADFGFIGIVLESIFVGLLLQGYAHWFSRARKTALVMGLQVTLMMAATKLSEATVTASLLSFGLGSTFLLYLLLKSYSIKPQVLRQALYENFANRS